MPTPAIIAFDGNVFSGKTTLIREFARLFPAMVIDEHSCFLDESATQMVHAPDRVSVAQSNQLVYLAAEARRASVPHGELNLLDRSFLSMAAHVAALYVVTRVDIRNWFVEQLRTNLHSRQVLRPTFFCFVTCAHNVIRRRFEEGRLQKGTDLMYCTNTYLEVVDSFLSAWVHSYGGLTIDTSTAAPVVLAEIVMQRFKVSRQDTYSDDDLCDRVQSLLTTLSVPIS